MEIQVAKFRQVLGLLKPVVPRKPTLKVLSNVLLKDKQAVATDMDTMVIVPLPEADTECLLPYQDVCKMLDYVQGTENLHIEVKDGKLAMSWSDGSSTLDAKDVKEFPTVPEFKPLAEASMDADTLILAMEEVLTYAATETTRPVLNGVTLVMGETIEVAAGDGFRMAYKSLPLQFPKEVELIVPTDSVKVLKLLWKNTPRTPPDADSLVPVITAKKQALVAIDGDKGMRFVFGDSATAIVKLVQGSPPAWLKLFPKEEPVTQVSAFGPQLELAVRRVMRVALEGSGIVRMEFEENKATISAAHDDQEVQSSVNVIASKGTPNRVALNASYLLDYLKGKEYVVSVSLASPGVPVAFQHRKDPKVLIMPMNYQWEPAKPAESEVAKPAESEEGKPGKPEEEASEKPKKPDKTKSKKAGKKSKAK